MNRHDHQIIPLEWSDKQTSAPNHTLRMIRQTDISTKSYPLEWSDGHQQQISALESSYEQTPALNHKNHQTNRHHHLNYMIAETRTSLSKFSLSQKNSKFDLILRIWTRSNVCHHTTHMFYLAPGLHYEIYIPKIPGLPYFLMLPVDDTAMWTAAVLILGGASVNKPQSVRHLFHPQYKNDMSLYQTTSNRHFTSYQA